MEFASRLDALLKHAEKALQAPRQSFTSKTKGQKGKGKTNSAIISFASEPLARAFFYKYSDHPWLTADGSRTVLVTLGNSKFEREVQTGLATTSNSS